MVGRVGYCGFYGFGCVFVDNWHCVVVDFLDFVHLVDMVVSTILGFLGSRWESGGFCRF